MKLTYLILLIVLSTTVSADILPINKFNGINTDNSPLVLTNGQTPDSENIVTDNGIGIEPRLGFLISSTEPSRGLWSFGKSDGTRYLITVSSNVLKASLGTSFTIPISTVSINVPTYASSLGDKFFFINTVDGLKYWDGTSVVAVDASKKADKITTFAGRLAIGNVTGNARVLYLSKLYDGTSLMAPANPSDDDAAQITVSGLLDEGIEGLYTFQGKLMVFKPTSFSCLYGSRRSNFTLRNFSDNIGLSGSESIQDCDGILRWLGKGRRVYEFDGTNFHKISEDIDILFGTIAQGDVASKSEIQTSAEDWNNGTISNTFYIDTNTVLGNIQLTFPDTFDSFRDGSNQSKPVWSSFNAGSENGTVDATTNSGKLSLISNVGIGDYISAYTKSAFNPYKVGTTYYYTINSLPLAGSFGPSNKIVFEIGPTQQTSFNLGGNTITYWYVMANGGFGPGLTFNMANSSDGALCSSCGGSSFNLPITIQLYVSTSAYTLTINGTSAKTGIHTWGDYAPYAYLGFSNNSGPSQVATVDNFGVTPETATFTAAVFQTSGFISSWSPATINDQKNSSGTITYQFNSSSTATMDNANWSNIVNGVIPTNSVNAYADWRAFFNCVYPNGQAEFNDFTVNWIEGSSIKLASNYVNQRYWLSVSISSTVNNKIIVYDKNNQWQKFSGINASAMCTHNSKYYFGNSTGIFESENGHSDNGIAITSSYQTAQIIPSGLNFWSGFKQLFMTTENSDSSLSITFQLNGISTVYVLGKTLMNITNGFQDLKFPFSISTATQGKLINFIWTVTGSSFWRILNGNLYYTSTQEPD